MRQFLFFFCPRNSSPRCIYQALRRLIIISGNEFIFFAALKLISTFHFSYFCFELTSSQFLSASLTRVVKSIQPYSFPSVSYVQITMWINHAEIHIRDLHSTMHEHTWEEREWKQLIRKIKFFSFIYYYFFSGAWFLITNQIIIIEILPSWEVFCYRS